METRLGSILARARGRTSLAAFARRLGWSYSFIRNLEYGERTASDEALCDIARKIEVDEDELLIAAYCDRSPVLAAALQRRGMVDGATKPVARAARS